MVDFHRSQVTRTIAAPTFFVSSWRALTLVGLRSPTYTQVTMPDARSNAVAQSNQLLDRRGVEDGQATLRLRLQTEIDRLALLIQDVKRQSIRVLEAADAIGDSTLLETTPKTTSGNRKNTAHVA